MNRIINFATSLYTNNNHTINSLALKFIASLYKKEMVKYSGLKKSDNKKSSFIS